MSASQIIHVSSPRIFRPAVAVLGAVLGLGLTTIVAPAALAEDDSTDTSAVVAEDDSTTTSAVTVSQTTWEAKGKGQILRVVVTTADSVRWQGKSSASWLKVERAGRSASKAWIYATKNRTGAERTATACFNPKGSAEQQCVTVTQPAGTTVKPYVTVSPGSKQEVGPAATTLTFDIQTNQDSWTATPNRTWVKVTEQGANTLTVSVDANTDRARAAWVVVRASTAKYVIRIKQDKGTTTTTVTPTEE
jgi:hypothetical protein